MKKENNNSSAQCGKPWGLREIYAYGAQFDFFYFCFACASFPCKRSLLLSVETVSPHFTGSCDHSYLCSLQVESDQQPPKKDSNDMGLAVGFQLMSSTIYLTRMHPVDLCCASCSFKLKSRPVSFNMDTPCDAAYSSYTVIYISRTNMHKIFLC